MKFLSLLVLCATLAVAIENKEIKLRGTVRDAATRAPISGATVTASGGQSRQDEVTDDHGFFRLLIKGTAPGGLIRVRVAKDGFIPYDQQVAASEEIPLEILLRHSQSPRADVERGRPAVGSPLNAHFIEQLKNTSSNPKLRWTAVRVLAKSATADPAAMAALIDAIFDPDWRVRKDAADVVGELKPASKKAITNLTVALSDVEPEVKSSAAKALANYGLGGRRAIPNLLGELGTGRGTNVSIMAALAEMGVDDPRLTDALIYKVGVGDETAEAILIRRAPLPKNVIARLIAELRKCVSCYSSVPHAIIPVLTASGPSGRAALREFVASLPPASQASMTLSWIEADPTTRAEVLQCIHLPEVTAVLSEWVRGPHEMTAGELVLPGRDLNAGGAGSRSLRAAMGILALNLGSTEAAWQVLRAGILGKSHTYESEGYAAYSAVVAGWLEPDLTRRAIPTMIEAFSKCRYPRADTFLAETLGKIGDLSTVSLLEPLAIKQDSRCSIGAATAISQIRARLSANPADRRPTAVISPVAVQAPQAFPEPTAAPVRTAQRTVEPLNAAVVAEMLASYFPAKNRMDNEPYSKLVSDLEAVGVRTTQDLSTLLAKHAAAALRRDREFVQHKMQTGEYGATQLDRLRKGIFFGHVGLARQVLELEFGPAFLTRPTPSPKR